MSEPVSCNNCVQQIVCKAYIDAQDMIKMFNATNGKIAKIPFQAEILATVCPHYLTPSDIKVDLLARKKKVESDNQ